MIVTVTLNPCVHHILAFEIPEEGRKVIKPVRSFFQPGGKGLNAARVIAAMGGEVLALTTWGDREGQLLLREVEYSNVPVKAVETSRPTRISTITYNMTSSEFIELLEPGVELDEEEVERLFQLFEASITGDEIVALNGSSPCAATDDFFRRAAEAARAKGCMVVVDSYSHALVNAVEATPHMIKLNRDEIRISFGMEIREEKDLYAFARKHLMLGVEHILVTDGSRGAWLFSREKVFRIEVPEVRELHAIGSGDAMLGAVLARFEQGDPLEEACRWGAAAGAVNAGRLEVCQFASQLVEDTLPTVRLEALSPVSS
ncbi:MAG: 1-phosphofructokinase family hexose kinase [Planctomycetota bacterium]|jgi:1-phosphofructokinase family hexose kinase